MKKKRWKKLLAWVITCCMLIGMTPAIWAETPENQEDPEWHELSFAEGSLRGGDWTWIYTDETFEYRVDTDLLNDNNYYVIWKVGRYYEDGTFDDYTQAAFDAGIYAEAEDGSSLSINGTKIRGKGSPFVDTDGFHVEAVLMRVSNDNDYEVGQVNTWTEIREAKYEFEYPFYNISVLPDEDYWINESIHYFVENSDHPYGWDTDLPVKEVIVENAEDDKGDGAVASINQEEHGWNIHTNRYGHAVATITYEVPEGSDDSGKHTFDIYVSDKVCRMNIFSDTGTDNLLPGESQTVTVETWCDCRNEEENYNYRTNDVKDLISIDYIFHEEETKDLISIKESGSGILDNGEVFYKTYKITAKEDIEPNRGTDVEFVCYWKDEKGNIEKDENGNKCIAEGQIYWININESYYTLSPLNLTEAPLSPGESITVTPELFFHQMGKSPQKVTDQLNYRWEYDPERVEVKDSNGNFVDSGCVTDSPSYTITKLLNDGTDITLIADRPDENDNYNEVVRHNWWLDWVDYRISFEGLRGDDWTYLYTDESSMEIRLDTSSLDGLKGYTVDWMIGKWNEQGEFIAENNASGNLFRVSGDGRSIIFDGTKLREENYPTLFQNGGFDLRAIVNYNNQPLTEECRWVEVREARYEYYYPLDDHTTTLPGDYYRIDKSFNCHIENVDYPDGTEIPVDIIDVRVENAKDTEGEGDVITLTPEEDGWNLDMNRYGHAIVTITYKPVDGSNDPGEHSFDFYLDNQIALLGITSDTRTDNLLPGESQIITVETACVRHDDETGINDQVGNAGDILSIGYRYRTEEFGNLLSIEEIDSGTSYNGFVAYKTYKITANENAETDRGAEVEFLSYWKDENGNIQKDEEGNDCVAKSEGRWFNIQECYYTLTPFDLPYSNPEKNVTMNLTPVLTEYSIGNEPTIITKGIRYRWEWDANAVDISGVDEDGYSNAKSFTITRRSEDWTNLILIAELPEDNGEYREVARYEYYLYRPYEHSHNADEVETSKKVVPATLTTAGSMNEVCNICGKAIKTTPIASPKTITLSGTSYTYDGKTHKPAVTVVGSDKKVIAASNYKVEYSSGCKNVGQYSVTITFTGNYSGKATKTFTILPKNTAISSVKAKKNDFTAKWKAQTTQTSGYEIQYSTSKSFTKATTKLKAINSNKTTSVKISKLKAKKKYYVRIRTYQAVKVSGKNVKLYSGWSSAKTVTTKK